MDNIPRKPLCAIQRTELETRWETDVRRGALPRTARDVLKALLGSVDVDGYCMPTHAELAEKAGASISTVIRVLQRAKALGLLVWAATSRPARHALRNNGWGVENGPSAYWWRPAFGNSESRVTEVDGRADDDCQDDGAFLRPAPLPFPTGPFSKSRIQISKAVAALTVAVKTKFKPEKVGYHAHVPKSWKNSANKSVPEPRKATRTIMDDTLIARLEREWHAVSIAFPSAVRDPIIAAMVAEDRTRAAVIATTQNADANWLSDFERRHGVCPA